MSGESDATASSRAHVPRSLVVFLEMIKVSHSIFALPFALAAAFVASGGWPGWLLLVKIITACILARTAAMAFNRWADARIDALNPRTARRAIPAGEIRRSTVGWLTLLFSGAFVGLTATINDLAFALSPVALLVLLGYSLLKRFTQSSHLVLGLALGLSPVGAWIAVRGEFDLFPVLLGCAVLFWTAGFDVIYACQDVDFDRGAGLHSIPRRWGVARALWISRGFHLLAVGLIVAAGLTGGLGPLYFLGAVIVAVILTYEQSLVRPGDLSRVDLAFFTLNGLVSLAFLATTLLDVITG